MPGEPTVTVAAIRRLAVAAQGYTGRYRRAGAADVEAAIRRLSCVQLDSISACLLPGEDWPLFRAPMRNGGRAWYGNVERDHPHLAAEILTEISERGPLGSRHFEGSGGGGMWSWKPAKAMLERLWNRGELAVAGHQGFQRLYDLTERVLPPEVLAAPEPSEAERLRELALRAVRARGVLTAGGIVEHWRLRGGIRTIEPTVDRLPDDGLLRQLKVDDGGPPVYVAPEAVLDRPAASASVLLSPFDNLLWDRPFARRILGFDHLIEVYKPAPQRQYGY